MVTSRPRKVLKAASRGVDLVHRPVQGITILIYHRVGASGGGQMNLRPEVFSRQVEWLREHRRVIDLDTAVREITGGATAERGVVLTFDDGTADWVDHVAPILVRHGVPATFYLTTGYPEGDHALPDGEAAISWSGVQELASTGLATIGSHTHSHRLLDRLAADEIADELDRGIDLLAGRLGESPRHFAYPKALNPSMTAHLCVRERFVSASLAGTRANRPGDDPHALFRSPIQAADGFDDFVRKANGGMGLEDTVRRQLNRLRYRGATS